MFFYIFDSFFYILLHDCTIAVGITVNKYTLNALSKGTYQRPFLHLSFWEEWHWAFSCDNVKYVKPIDMITDDNWSLNLLSVWEIFWYFAHSSNDKKSISMKIELQDFDDFISRSEEYDQCCKNSTSEDHWEK